jgi:hypothetical protein
MAIALRSVVAGAGSDLAARWYTRLPDAPTLPAAVYMVQDRDAFETRPNAKVDTVGVPVAAPNASGAQFYDVRVEIYGANRDSTRLVVQQLAPYLDGFSGLVDSQLLMVNFDAVRDEPYDTNSNYYVTVLDLAVWHGGTG